MFKGLRTTIHRGPNLDAGKRWCCAAFGTPPYSDRLLYVGFNTGGYELGVQSDTPTASMTGNVVAYRGVDNTDAAVAYLVARGATSHRFFQDVDEGICVASVRDPLANTIGVIQNPNFGIAPGASK